MGCCGSKRANLILVLIVCGLLFQKFGQGNFPLGFHVNFLSKLCTRKTGVGQRLKALVLLGFFNLKLFCWIICVPKAQVDRKWSGKWTSIDLNSAFICNSVSHAERQTYRTEEMFAPKNLCLMREQQNDQVYWYLNPGSIGTKAIAC